MSVHRPCLVLLSLLLFQPRVYGLEARQEQIQEQLPVAVPNEPSKTMLRPGEVFSLNITWRPPLWLIFIPPISAGSITLETEQLTEHEGSPAARIHAEVRSSGSFNSLAGIEVQDRYETLVDPVTLCSRQFRFIQREGKRKRDVQIDFGSAAGKLHIREWNASKNPIAETRNEWIETSEGCIQDLVSVFYAVRKLRLEPGARNTLAISSDRGKVQRIQIVVEGEEALRTDAGSFQALRISTSGLFGGLFRSGGEFKVWLDRTTKIPVKFDAKVKLGRVTGSLVRYQPPR